MPDISKCDNKLCPMRDTCFRFTCKPSDHWQSYSSFTPNSDGKCDSFMVIPNYTYDEFLDGYIET